MIRSVLSDLDDTLFDHARATRSALGRIVAIEPALASWSMDDLDQRHRILLEELHGEVLSGRLSIEEARERRFTRLLTAAAASVSAARAREVARQYRAA